MPKRLANHALARIAFVAAPALLLAGHAAASPIVVLNDGPDRDTIISRGEHRIHIFQDTLEIDPWPTPGGDARYSLILNFQFEFGDPERVSGIIAGNMLPSWPSFPLQTPSLVFEDGLRLEDLYIDANMDILAPSYDSEFGDTLPAFITHGTHPFSAFNLESFAAGDMAYIGFANSQVTQFGYMQIERVNLLDWKLIGYAYDPSGGGILVQNLVPAPSALTLALLAALPRRRRHTPSHR